MDFEKVFDSFNFPHISLAQFVLFDPFIGLCWVLPLQVRADKGAIAINGYSALPKSLRLEPHYQMV